MESTIAYYHEVASQMVVISSLLAGFTVNIISSLMTSTSKKKINDVILIITTFASCCFLIATFSMTKIMMITTEGYSLEVTPKSFEIPNMIGSPVFLLGVVALCIVVSLSGWTKSKKLGIMTTIMGIVTLIMLALAMSESVIK